MTRVRFVIEATQKRRSFGALCTAYDIKGTKWRINRSLAGEWVQVVRVEQRMMVFYCTTLIRELDPGIQRSKIIERWIPRPSSSLPTVKDV